MNKLTDLTTSEMQEFAGGFGVVKLFKDAVLGSIVR